MRYALHARKQARAAQLQAEASRGGGASSVMDPAAQLAFEHNMERARGFASVARKEQVTFWQELVEAVPDLDRMFDVGSRVHVNTRLAESHFQQAMHINPNSPVAMRAYAAFVLDVLNDRPQVRRHTSLTHPPSSTPPSSTSLPHVPGPGVV